MFLVGNVDIVNGNLKLILGLIWSLIVRYQIGKSKFPPRKLMLAWLKVSTYNSPIHQYTLSQKYYIVAFAYLECNEKIMFVYE